MKFGETPVARDTTGWVSLGEARRTLGIAPGTLRRRADDGRVPVFTTPGGHRRLVAMMTGHTIETGVRRDLG